ncbi:MAG: DUF2177 family protein [Polaromonas sp.]|nr:DUF2177 family protein [Polaromonas sp.]
MAKFLRVYLAVLATMLALDALWLGLIATEWYATAVGHLMADTPSWPAAVAFYLLYPLGLAIFVLKPHENASLLKATGMGALFGLFAYATYDLTNLAMLADWPVYISVVDIAWGCLLSGGSVAAGKWVLDRSQSRSLGA